MRVPYFDRDLFYSCVVFFTYVLYAKKKKLVLVMIVMLMGAVSF